jgi:hypothetical protein
MSRAHITYRISKRSNTCGTLKALQLSHLLQLQLKAIPEWMMSLINASSLPQVE